MPKKLQRELKMAITFEPNRMQDEYLKKIYEIVMPSTKYINSSKTEIIKKNRFLQ